MTSMVSISSWKQKIGNSESGFFHHAFIIPGERDSVKDSLFDFFEDEFGFAVAGNPDISELRFTTFGIDESRALKASQSRRAANEGAKKIFVLSAHSFTVEAQNSLLKIFEEPTADTVFFILSPSAQFFLPTLLSRAVCLPEDGEQGAGEAKAFLKKDYPERLAMALDAAKDEEDPGRALRLIEDIIRYYYDRGEKGKRSPEETRALLLALQYREFANGRSPSPKMMLEHLALVAPK